MPTEFKSGIKTIHKGSEINQKGVNNEAGTSLTFNTPNLNQTTDQTVTQQTTTVTRHGNAWSGDKTTKNSSNVVQLFASKNRAPHVYHKGGKHITEGSYYKEGTTIHNQAKQLEIRNKYAKNQFTQEVKQENLLSTSVQGQIVIQDIKLKPQFNGTRIIKYNTAKMLFEGEDSLKGVELRDNRGNLLAQGKDYEVTLERELKTHVSNYGYSSQFIPTPVIIIGGMAAAYFSGGLFSNVYANAALGFLAQRATSVMLSTGSFKAVIDNFNNDQCIKDLAISLGTVGIMDQLKLPNTKVIDKIQKGVVQTAVDTTLKVVIDKQSFDHAVTTSAKFGFANVVGSVIAGHIGGLYRDKEQNLDYLSHKLLHGVKGALEGFIMDPSLKGILAGSVGSMAAEVYADDATYGLQKGEGLQNHVVEKIHEAERKGTPLDPKEVQELNTKYISDTLQKSRIVAGITAAALQQDVSVAALSGGTSVEHNVIPGLIIGGILMYEAYDLYHTYKTEGVEATVRKLAINCAITAISLGAGKMIWMVAGQRCLTAAETFATYMNANPTLKYTFNKIIQPVAENYKKLDQAIEKGITKGWDKGKSYFGGQRTGLSKFSKSNQQVMDTEGIIIQPKIDKLPWNSWRNLPKETYQNREYAKLGNRLYTEHAVNKMQPRSLGRIAGSLDEGRSFSPNLVEEVIRNGSQRKVMADGVERTIHSSGTAQVVTEQEGKIVVTINPFRGEM